MTDQPVPADAPVPKAHPQQRNIVPEMLNSDFIRVALFTVVQSGLSVGALITATGSVSLAVMGKEFIALFCATMLTRISHASAVNGLITAGKVV